MPRLVDDPPPDRPSPDRFPPDLALSSGPFAGPRGFGGWARELPLNGVTFLAVEDSRFTSDALRLMVRRAGARLRRAETMEAARAHLRVYRPDVMLVDLGLPDGRGDSLIREVVLAPRRPKVILGISGLADGRVQALSAGADGFIEKPLQSLAQLCRILRPLLPDLDIQPAACAPPLTETRPDPLALQDDLTYAAHRLQGDPGPDQQRYVGGFLQGIGRYAEDAALQGADQLALDDLRAVLAARLKPGAGFSNIG